MSAVHDLCIVELTVWLISKGVMLFLQSQVLLDNTACDEWASLFQQKKHWHKYINHNMMKTEVKKVQGMAHTHNIFFIMLRQCNTRTCMKAARV